MEGEEAPTLGREHGAEQIGPFMVQKVQSGDEFFHVEVGVETAYAAVGPFAGIHAVGVDFYSHDFDDAGFSGYDEASSVMILQVSGEYVAGGVFVAVNDQITVRTVFVAQRMELDAGEGDEFGVVPGPMATEM